MEQSLDMRSGVYEIVNIVTGCRYVGSATQFRKRCREHIRQLEAGVHHSKYLQRSWSLRGPACFSFRPLLVCDKRDLIFFEQRTMDALKPAYNIVKTAGSQLGYRHSDETRRRMSIARRRNPSSPRKGLKHTEDSRRLISASRKGKGGGPRSETWRASIGAALKGRVVSAEQRLKISATLTGHKQSPAQVEKRRQKLIGRKMPAGFAAAASARLKGMKLPPSHCESIGRSKAKLTDDQVREIRMLRTQGRTRKSLAEHFEIDPASITNIVARTSYAWVKS